jgi:hypothetical protein
MSRQFCGGKIVRYNLHLALGKGIVDYKSLNNKDYDSTITMEVTPETCPEQDIRGKIVSVKCRIFRKHFLKSTAERGLVSIEFF